MNKQKYFIKTLGCKANWLDSQVIESSFHQKGWLASSSADDADLLVVNTCTVTDEADRQSQREAILALKKNPNVKVVLTGCGAEIEPDETLRKTGAQYVIGNQNKNQFASLIEDAFSTGKLGKLGGVQNYGELLSQHPMDREWATPESSFMVPEEIHALSTGRTRGFLKIQEGCNSFCTYCIIPYGRGPSRSLKISEILDQVNALVAQGISEIVLTGTNIGEYGVDLNSPSPKAQDIRALDPEATLLPNRARPSKTPMFDELVRDILNKTNLKRLRLSSLDPSEISDDLIALIGKEAKAPNGGRLCAHFHVSLQSPQSKVLRLMKRKYGAEEVASCLRKIGSLAAPTTPTGGAFVGMDIITGFPGEGESEFQETVEILKSLPWSRLHVFPYSERKGTPATRLKEKVPEKVRKERAQILRNLSLERLKGAYQALVGETLEDVLFESPTKGPDRDRVWLGGYSENYYRVLVPFPTIEAAEEWAGKIGPVRAESLFLDSRQGDVAVLGSLLTKSSPLGRGVDGEAEKSRVNPLKSDASQPTIVDRNSQSKLGSSDDRSA
jgi:threonylcarbamoyladenosine tRNA methylthiotransferase MtaB